MDQLRDHKEEFEKKNIRILVFGPENNEDFRKYWEENKMPFIGFPDAKKIMKEYGQESKWYKLGRMPFQIAADSEGNVIEKHWGQSMKDIPDIEGVLSLYSDKGKS